MNLDWALMFNVNIYTSWVPDLHTSKLHFAGQFNQEASEVKFMVGFKTRAYCMIFLGSAGIRYYPDFTQTFLSGKNHRLAACPAWWWSIDSKCWNSTSSIPHNIVHFTKKGLTYYIPHWNPLSQNLLRWNPLDPKSPQTKSTWLKSSVPMIRKSLSNHWNHKPT